MKTSWKVSCCVGVLAFLGLSTAQAAITVDGDLSDWSVTVADNNGSVWTNAGSGLPAFLSMEEDQDDAAGPSGQVGPYQGGQNYDAEFIGVTFDGTTLSIAIVTGQRPDNGFGKYGPGDIRIDLSDNTSLGIEVGGGFGGGVNGDAGGAISEGAAGATYKLDGSGNTIGATTGASSYGTLSGLTHAASQTAGSIWSNASWLSSPLTNGGETQFQIGGGSYLGLADYVYTRNDVTDQHAIIELSFNVAGVLDPADIAGISWKPSCGNDHIYVETEGGITTVVPEPATCMVWGGLGLIVGAAGYRRRRRNG